MNIVLIGYRGTGKTVAGALAAERLGMEYVSMDARIVEEAGMSIPEIVENHGWTFFRDMESAIVRKLSTGDNMVIDTGGGVIERPENMELLRTNGRVIWLKASGEVIVSRICGDTQRPSLTAEKSFTEEVADVLAQRIPRYRSGAQYEIDTDRLTAEQVSEKIVALGKEE